MGGHGFVQREFAVDRYPPSGVDQAVPLETRQAFPTKRAELAARFAKLPTAQRKERQREFREKLRHICASDLECKGFWQLRFEPLIQDAGPSPARSPSLASPAKGSPQTPRPRAARPKPSRKPPPQEHAHVEVTILAFVRKHSGKYSRKVCVWTLCGHADSRVVAAGLDQAPEFGTLADKPLEAVHARVASMSSRGFLKREARTGALRSG
jgi:hypothetical protein